MKERWRLVVEGLGKIERAEVDVHPLMLLVGPNNTGKSYLASLLWGLAAMPGGLNVPQGPVQQACDAWLAHHLVQGREQTSVVLTDADIELFDRLFESALAANRDSLISRIFNNDAVTARKLEFRNISGVRQIALEWQPYSKGYLLVVRSGSEQQIPLGLPNSPHGVDMLGNSVDLVGSPVKRLLMYTIALGSLFLRESPIFLPASRTGFMQLYKAAVRRSLHGAFRPEPDDRGWLDLTAPTFEFLDLLALKLRGDQRSEQFAEEADLLESALGGRVELVEGVGVNEFRYHPDGAQASLSMSRSSSLVTELAPLILVLRHLSGFPVLILEEPEAHLHPEVQRRVAQVVVRLIRKGLHVWITTHSENLCQQINNFLKLGALDPERRAEAQQRLGYGPQDYLDLDEVAGYQFKLDERGERSFVEAMEKTPHGLVMPTFNTPLLRLAEEVDALDELVDEAEA